MAVPLHPRGQTHYFRLHTWPAWAAYAGSKSLLRLSFGFSDVSIHPRIPGKYGISLAYRGPFSLKTFLEENSSAQARQLRRTIEFAGKHFVYGRSRKQRDRCWPPVVTDPGKRSNEPWNWFVKTSIPGALSPVLENFCRSFSRPNWPPLGLRGWYLSGFFKALPPNRPL